MPLNTFYSSSEEPLTLPDQPEDWPRVFERHLNAGDLDAVMALYEPEARFVARSGETLTGREQIRNVLAGMIDAKRACIAGSSRRSPLAISLIYTPTLRARRWIARERLRFGTGRSRSSAASPMESGN